MANKSFLTSDQLDFDQLKQGLQSYLEGQEQFSDYDFEGSNLSALLDLLTYNTYLNSLYLNQVGSEMFLDTALLRSSIVSHAKELNYIPSSMVSATANVNIVVNTAISNAQSLPATVTVPINYEMSTTVGDNNYIFTTDSLFVLSSPTLGDDGYYRFIANNISVYEGDIITETFVANTTSDASVSFEISSANVDISSIDVVVQTSNTDTSNTIYEKRDSLLGLNSTDNVFFLEGSEDYKYKVVFGNGITGKALQNGNIVKVKYRNTHADEPNGANTFTTSSQISGYDVDVTVNSKAELGTVAETNASIKFNAPRYFATQGRAVTVDDYKTLVRSNFNQFQTVTVYGGDEEVPARYGKVVVVVKPSATRKYLNDTEKNQIIQFLKPRTPLSIDPVTKDAEFNSVRVTANVNYSVSQTTQSTNDIVGKVRTAITDYNTNNLGDFGSILRFSRLASAIDEADASIIGNELFLQMYREIVPVPDIVRTVVFSFENRLDQDEDERCISSTGFTYEGENCTLSDDGNGTIVIKTIRAGQEIIVNSNAGSIEYDTGNVTLLDFAVSAFVGTSIRIYAIPELRDIKSTKNIILEIGSDEVNVNVTGIVD